MDFSKYSMFKVPNRHKRFDYQPRFYDQRKENLKLKIAEAEAAEKKSGTVKTGDYANRIRFRESTSDRWGNSAMRSQHMMSNIRLLIILCVLIASFYFIFKGLDVMGPAIDNFKNK